MEYRSSSYSELGGIYVMEGNLARAEEFLKRSLEYDVNNVRTRQLLATVCRLRQQPVEAREVLSGILDTDPLNHLAHFEQYLLEPSPAALQRFQSMIRNESPHETYLEIAAYYRNLRRNADALRVLAVAPEQATVRYWQAYLLRDRSPAESRQALDKASSLSPYLVFPFREESIPVFEWAAAVRPTDWKPTYYLGLIYWGLRRDDDARKMFDNTGDRPDYAAAYVTRAFLEKGSNAAKAQSDFERAFSLDKKDWRNWYHLANFYTERGTHDRALTVAEQGGRQYPNEDAIKVLTARAYLNTGRYAGLQFRPCQRDHSPLRGPERHSQSLRSMPRQPGDGGHESGAVRAGDPAIGAFPGEYPERLGTGAPADPDYRVQDYLLTFCYQEMKQPTQAAEAGRASVRIRHDVGCRKRNARSSRSRIGGADFPHRDGAEGARGTRPHCAGRLRAPPRRRVAESFPRPAPARREPSCTLETAIRTRIQRLA